MGWKTSVAGLSALVAAAVVTSADAATRKRPAGQQIVSGPVQRTVYSYTDDNGRQRTKIIVQRRSYLDAGTWVLPGQRKYDAYVVQPYYSAFDVLGPGHGSRDRNPIAPRWELGGN
jgi:hypothetical protein